MPHKDPEARRAWKRRNRAAKVEQYRGYQRKYSRVHPDWKHASHIRSTYNIPIEQYMEMLLAQHSSCAICKRPDHLGKRLSVDHDHRCCPGRKSCGKCVRALLCSRCNRHVSYSERHPVSAYIATLNGSSPAL